MADGIKFDFSEVLALAADLATIPANASENVRKAVQVTAHHVRDDWREPLKGSPTLPSGPSTISYDIEETAGGVSAEIGPEIGKGRIGGLIGALEYGIPSRGGPTGYGAAALQRNQADFQKGLEIALEQAQRRAGL